jgi:glycosyltransferase involved in cell wall biosynthesis
MSSLGLAQVVYIFLAVCAIGFLALLIISTLLWDIKQISLQKRRRKNPYSRALKARPTVSIVVVVEKLNSNLSNALRSIVGNNYRKYEILVIDGQKDNRTKTVVQNFQKKYPKKKIKLIKKSGPLEDVQIKRFCQGGYVMVMDSDCFISKNTLHAAMSYFALKNNILAINLGLTTSQDYTLTNLRQHFELALRDNLQKANSVIGLSSVGIGSIYNREIFGYDKVIRPAYLGDATIGLSGRLLSSSLAPKKKITARLFIVGIIGAVTYFGYLAFFHHYDTLLAIVWVYSILLMFFCVLACGQIKASRKATLLLLAPMACLLFYASAMGGIFTRKHSL